jgi:hypothetical protein
MSENPKKSKNHSPLSIVLIIVALLAVLYLTWSYIAGDLWLKPSDPDKEPKITWLKKDTPEKDVVTKQEAVAEKEKPAALVRLTPGDEEPLSPLVNECIQTADKMRLFFEHLDSQEYIKAYHLKGSSLEHFNNLISKLIANPPIIVRETDDLFAILKNMAHLYRILGAQDVLLIKDILSKEQMLIEPTLALFDKWSVIESQCSGDDLPTKLPLPGLYLYAGFFLNTLGGQSYLLRRDPHIRVLLRYYSVLVLDRANNEGVNIYGIDIRYHLNSVIEEMDAAGNLADSQAYISNLLQLQEKYQAEYGNK